MDHAAGGPGPTALPEVVQDVADPLIGQAGLLQDRALAFRETGLASATVDHADAFALAAGAAESEITVAPEAYVRAVGILATESFGGVRQ